MDKSVDNNFKVGDRVRFVDRTENRKEYTDIKLGEKGTITGVQDRLVHVRFDFTSDVRMLYFWRVELVAYLPGSIATEILAEYQRAREKHPANPSPHHNLAVLEEEVAELRQHVYNDTSASPDARKEAIQVGAMALAYVMEVIENAKV